MVVPLDSPLTVHQQSLGSLLVVLWQSLGSSLAVSWQSALAEAWQSLCGQLVVPCPLTVSLQSLGVPL